MIEELAEECHPRVERRAQAGVRLDVRDEVDRLIIGGAEQAVQAGADRRSWSPGCAAAAATAAGLFAVWSTIRLLIVRGSESKTTPLVCV